MHAGVSVFFYTICGRGPEGWMAYGLVDLPSPRVTARHAAPQETSCRASGAGEPGVFTPSRGNTSRCALPCGTPPIAYGSPP